MTEPLAQLLRAEADGVVVPAPPASDVITEGHRLRRRHRIGTTVAVLAVVPFLRGSARGQAGGAAAGPFDLTVFGCGAVLVAITAAALWAGTRVPPRKPAPHPTSAAPRPPAPDAATERRDPGRTGSARP